jgi:hypothetical protein
MSSLGNQRPSSPRLFATTEAPSNVVAGASLSRTSLGKRIGHLPQALTTTTNEEKNVMADAECITVANGCIKKP